MNDRLRKAMISGWVRWHHSPDDGYVPSVNPAFERGFTVACETLLPLLRQALEHVEATAEASHLTDGFRRREKNRHDRLAEAIRAHVGE